MTADVLCGVAEWSKPSNSRTELLSLQLMNDPSSRRTLMCLTEQIDGIAVPA